MEGVTNVVVVINRIYQDRRNTGVTSVIDYASPDAVLCLDLALIVLPLEEITLNLDPRLLPTPGSLKLPTLSFLVALSALPFPPTGLGEAVTFCLVLARLLAVGAYNGDRSIARVPVGCGRSGVAAPV